MKKEDYPTWQYKSEDFTEMPTGSIGFVYRVVFSELNDDGDRYQYIGKKLAVSTEKKKVLINGNKRKNHIRFTYKNKGGKRVDYEVLSKNTNWQSYIGSSELIEELKLTPMYREILHLCSRKDCLSYYEQKEMFTHEALENDAYLNSNIGGTYYKQATIKYKEEVEDEQS